MADGCLPVVLVCPPAVISYAKLHERNHWASDVGSAVPARCTDSLAIYQSFVQHRHKHLNRKLLVSAKENIPVYTAASEPTPRTNSSPRGKSYLNARIYNDVHDIVEYCVSDWFP